MSFEFNQSQALKFVIKQAEENGQVSLEDGLIDYLCANHSSEFTNNDAAATWVSDNWCEPSAVTPRPLCKLPELVSWKEKLEAFPSGDTENPETILLFPVDPPEVVPDKEAQRKFQHVMTADPPPTLLANARERLAALERDVVGLSAQTQSVANTADSTSRLVQTKVAAIDSLLDKSLPEKLERHATLLEDVYRKSKVRPWLIVTGFLALLGLAGSSLGVQSCNRTREMIGSVVDEKTKELGGSINELGTKVSVLDALMKECIDKRVVQTTSEANSSSPESPTPLDPAQDREPQVVDPAND